MELSLEKFNENILSLDESFIKGKELYDSNPFLRGMVDLMQSPPMKELTKTQIRTDGEWRSAMIYARLYTKIEKFYKKFEKDKPIPKEFACWMLYSIMTDPEYRKRAIAPDPPYKSKKNKKLLGTKQVINIPSHLDSLKKE
jgi:hypothetical protein